MLASISQSEETSSNHGCIVLLGRTYGGRGLKTNDQKPLTHSTYTGVFLFVVPWTDQQVELFHCVNHVFLLYIPSEDLCFKKQQGHEVQKGQRTQRTQRTNTICPLHGKKISFYVLFHGLTSGWSYFTVCIMFFYLRTIRGPLF